MQQSLIVDFVQAYPELTALAVLVVGFVCARLVQRAVERSLTLADERIARYGTSSRAIISPALIAFSRAFAFWLVIAVSVVGALALLEHEGLATAVDHSFAFLGRLLVGVAIVGVGHILGTVARGIVARYGPSPNIARVGARLAHGAIVLVAVVVGIAQLNIDISFISQLLLLTVGIVFAGIALAFALGAPRHVANLLAYGELTQYRIGERIRVCGHEGAIVEIRATGVDIATEEGIVAVPAAEFARRSVLRLAERSDD